MCAVQVTSPVPNGTSEPGNDKIGEMEHMHKHLSSVIHGLTDLLQSQRGTTGMLQEKEDPAPATSTDLPEETSEGKVGLVLGSGQYIHINLINPIPNKSKPIKTNQNQ